MFQAPSWGWALLFVCSITLYIMYSTRVIYFQSGRTRPPCGSVRWREMAHIAFSSADIRLNLLTSLTCTAVCLKPGALVDCYSKWSKNGYLPPAQDIPQWPSVLALKNFIEFLNTICIGASCCVWSEYELSLFRRMSPK